jgi:hypothetical protein
MHTTRWPKNVNAKEVLEDEVVDNIKMDLKMV